VRTQKERKKCQTLFSLAGVLVVDTFRCKKALLRSTPTLLRLARLAQSFAQCKKCQTLFSLAGVLVVDTFRGERHSFIGSVSLFLDFTDNVFCWRSRPRATREMTEHRWEVLHGAEICRNAGGYQRCYSNDPKNGSSAGWVCSRF
jgi:hypothetical protein